MHRTATDPCEERARRRSSCHLCQRPPALSGGAPSVRTQQSVVDRQAAGQEHPGRKRKCKVGRPLLPSRPTAARRLRYRWRIRVLNGAPPAHTVAGRKCHQSWTFSTLELNLLNLCPAWSFDGSATQARKRAPCQRVSGELTLALGAVCRHERLGIATAPTSSERASGPLGLQ